MTTTISPVKLILPKTKSEVDRRFCSQTFGMIGAPGAGKSSFWAQGNFLFIQTENGLNHLAVFKVPCLSWDDFENIKSALIQEKQGGNFPYEGVIIDTIDELVKLADEEIINRMRTRFKDKASVINSIFDYPASSDKGNPAWGWRRDLVIGSLKDLSMSLGVAVAYIGHLDHREIKTQTQVFHKRTISIGGALGNDLVSWCDHFINFESEKVGSETKRVLRTITDSTLDAKSRGNIIPDRFPMGNDTKINWEKFRALFQ